MRCQKNLSFVITVFIGVAIGIGITLMAGRLLNYIGYGSSLTNKPVNFGDIKIWAGKPAKIGQPPHPEIEEMLGIEKNDIPFLTIHKSKSGNVNGLYLLKKSDEPIFFMTPNSISGKWNHATYSRGKLTSTGKGETYVDIDVDGNFDFKLVLDADGNRISRSIFIDGVWQQVDYCSVEKMKAVIGETEYAFDPNSGYWQQGE